jgi:hypothetical protein
LRPRPTLHPVSPTIYNCQMQQLPHPSLTCPAPHLTSSLPLMTAGLWLSDTLPPAPAALRSGCPRKSDPTVTVSTRLYLSRPEHYTCQITALKIQDIEHKCPTNAYYPFLQEWRRAAQLSRPHHHMAPLSTQQPPPPQLCSCMCRSTM